MSARAIAIHGNVMSGERRANLEIKSECPALAIVHLKYVNRIDDMAAKNFAFNLFTSIYRTYTV